MKDTDNNPFGFCENCGDQKMPSMGEMLSNLWTDAKATLDRFGAGENIRVSESVAKARISTCMSCPFFVHSSNRCSRCGCFMSIKVHLQASKCPENKWAE